MWLCYSLVPGSKGCQAECPNILVNRRTLSRQHVEVAHQKAETFISSDSTREGCTSQSYDASGQGLHDQTPPPPPPPPRGLATRVYPQPKPFAVRALMTVRVLLAGRQTICLSLMVIGSGTDVLWPSDMGSIVDLQPDLGCASTLVPQPWQLALAFAGCAPYAGRQ